MARGRILIAGAAALGCLPFASRAEVLYDSGSVLAGGRTVNAIFAVVQPFVVPEPGWHVSSIGTDGLTLVGPASPGLRFDLFQTSIPGPSGGLPIATCTVELTASGTTSAWASAPIAVDLAPGQYFVRWTENGDSTYVAMIRPGATGDQSFSWRRDTGAMIIAAPTALRIEGSTMGSCPADLDDDGIYANGAHRDGAVTIDDLLYFVAAFEAGDVGVDLDNGTGTGIGDGAVTIDDLLFFLTHFESGC